MVITLLLMTIGYGQIPQSEYNMPIVVNNCAEHIPLDISVTAGDANESQSPEHRYRRIYFVHGLGGDASAMERMANSFEDKSLNIKDFPARKCHATRLEYTKSTSSIVSTLIVLIILLPPYLTYKPIKGRIGKYGIKVTLIISSAL